MSLCFRFISNKITPLNSFVNTRKHVTHLDRQLPKHIKPSTFLEEFLGGRTISSAPASPKHKLPDSSTSFVLHQNLSLTAVESFDDRTETPTEKNIHTQDRSNYWTEYASSPDKHIMKAPVSYAPTLSGRPAFEMAPNDMVFWSRSFKPNNGLMRSFENESWKYACKRFSTGIRMHSSNDSELLDFEKRMILLAEGKVGLESAVKPQASQGASGRPSQEQLEHILKELSEALPKLFKRPMDYSNYDGNIVFVNNIRGTTTQGIFNYVKQVSLLRTVGHLKFAFVSFDILKITMHPEDDTIKVRWRIRGMSGLKVMRMFWRVKVWRMSISNELESWYDGFSTFYVNGNGQIWKHVADKMMPDQEELEGRKDQDAMATKLALFLGLAGPQTALSDASALSSSLGVLGHLFSHLEREAQCLETAMLPLERIE